MNRSLRKSAQPIAAKPLETGSGVKENTLRPFFLTAGATALLTLLLTLLIYALNGIYPFGTGSVVCDDMTQQTITNYTYFWDVLHSGGAKSLIFNWETAAGAQCLTTGFYIIKPWDILFTLLAGREGIVNGISFYLLARLVVCSVVMQWFIHRNFKVEPIWQPVLSLAYTFSAFIVLYYTNMGWIDAAILLPLIVSAFLRMMNTGKWLPYLLLVSYFTIMSIYLAFMLYLFLLLIGFLYIMILHPRKTRGAGLVRFGVTSVLALAISAVINLPSIHYLFRSERYSLKSEETMLDTFLKVLRTNTTYSTMKLSLVLLVTGIIGAFLLIMFFNIKRSRRYCLFFGVALFVLLVPVFYENVNLLWHLGSYVSFPLRYFYMFIFIGVCMGAYVLSDLKDEIHRVRFPANLILIAGGVILAAWSLYLLATRVFNTEKTVSGIKYNKLINADSEGIMLVSFLLLAACYLLFLYVGKTKFWRCVGAILCTAVLLAEGGMLANLSFGVGSAREGRLGMYSLEYIDEALAIKKDLPLENDNLSRIKDADTRLNSNYPMLLDYPAMSNFTHIVSSDMTSTMEGLGYSQIYTRVLDNVGTPLTDALLNIKYALSNRTLSETEYTDLQPVGDMELYENRYTLPAGLIVDDAFMQIDVVQNADCFKTNDQLYRVLSGQDRDIFETQPFALDENGEFSGEFHVTGTKHAYLIVYIENTAQNRGSFSVMADGKRVDLSYFGDGINYYYPNNFHNTLIDLGVRTDEDVPIDVGAIKDVPSGIKGVFAAFDASLLDQLCEKNKDNHAQITTTARTLTATYTAQDDAHYVFLPVAYDDGWTCTVNGEKAEVLPALSSFMAVKLQKGENTVKLTYLPWGMKKGAAVTVASLFLAAALYVISRKKAIPMEADGVVFRVVEIGYIGLCALAYGILYLVPIIYHIFGL